MLKYITLLFLLTGCDMEIPTQSPKVQTCNVLEYMPWTPVEKGTKCPDGKMAVVQKTTWKQVPGPCDRKEAIPGTMRDVYGCFQ